MRKYLEYFPGDFDDTIADKIKVENKPYVGFSKTQGVNFTIVPEKSEDDDVVDLTAPYVTFKAEEAGSTIGLARKSSYQTLEYSTDGVNWTSMSTTTSIVLENIGDKVFVRGKLSKPNNISRYTMFKMTGTISASGNCQAIWDYEDLNGGTGAYIGYRLFQNCTSLVTAPELPAELLASHCYDSMFNNCARLNYVKCLAANNNTVGCTDNWLNGVSSTGTFVKAAGAEWTAGVDGIPFGWAVEDVVL